MTIRLVLRFAFVIFCLSAVLARGQDTTATLLGTVTDSSGALLPGVTVTVKDVDTSQTRTVVADERGRYRTRFCCPVAMN